MKEELLMKRSILPLFFIILVLTGCGTQTPADTNQTPAELYTGSRTASHEAVSAYDSLTAAEITGAVNQKTYFEHASVGRNILNGVQKLIAEGLALKRGTWETWAPVDDDGNPTYYTDGNDSTGYVFDTTSMNETKAGTIIAWFAANDGLFDSARGNPSAADKIDYFRSAVDTYGIGAAADVAIMKFCWIDPDADLSDYKEMMSSLQEKYPHLVLVYCTMPLTNSTDSDTAARNTFNNALRSYCSTNNLWLFDIADIESHKPDGTAYTGAETGAELAWPDYSRDSGHMNAGDYDLRPAKALITLLARIGTAD
jgi:hypothetical protein